MKKKLCKKCGQELEIRPVKKTAAQQKKTYYYTHYYYCTQCESLFHDDEFKVVNPQTVPLSFDDVSKTVYIEEKRYGKFDAEIWTDGACVYNGTPRAKAAWAFVSGKEEQFGIVEGAQTNNRGEGYAIYYALKWAGESGAKKIKIYTDSQISIHSATKHFSKVVANREIFEGIAKIIEQYSLEVTYEKVLGHSGDINNDRADVLANTAAAAK